MPRKPTFAPEVYPVLGRQISDIFRGHKGLITSRADLIAAVAKELETGRLCSEARAPLGLRQLRDVAWWCGAAAVGTTVGSACYAIADSWARYRDLERASLRHKGARLRMVNLRIKRLAHAEGIPVREMRARIRRESGLSLALWMIRSPERHKYTSRILRRHAETKGRWFVAAKLSQLELALSK